MDGGPAAAGLCGGFFCSKVEVVVGVLALKRLLRKV